MNSIEKITLLESLRIVASLRLELAEREDNLRGDGLAYTKLSEFYDAKKMEASARITAAQSLLCNNQRITLQHTAIEGMLRIQIEAGRGVRAICELFASLREEILSRQPKKVFKSPPTELNPTHWIKQLI